MLSSCSDSPDRADCFGLTAEGSQLRLLCKEILHKTYDEKIITYFFKKLL